MTSLIDDVMACDVYTHCRMEQYSILTLHNEGAKQSAASFVFLPPGGFWAGPLALGGLESGIRG